MKKITLLLLAIFGMAFHVSAGNAYDNLQGWYYSAQGNYSIQVKTYSNGIRVKGLPGYRNSGYQKFRSVNYNKFKDRSGNIIEVGRRGAINYVNRHRRISQTFRSKRYNNYGNSSYRSDNRYRPDRRNDYNDIVSQMEGQYRVLGSRDIMELVDTREGIKTRVVGTTAWTFYNQEYTDVWIDGKGNKIVFKGTGILKWESARGRQAITLNKIERRYY